jgi:hypothetical protein
MVDGPMLTSIVHKTPQVMVAAAFIHTLPPIQYLLVKFPCLFKGICLVLHAIE